MKKYYKSFLMALSMFTIIPTPYIDWDDEGIKNMMKFYPAIGLIVGIIWSAVYYAMSFFCVTRVLKTAIVMIVPFIITGMLHLDGFMDVCDAILSRRERAEKLRILKDSTIGAFAVVSLVMLFFIQFGTVNTIIAKDYPPFIFVMIPVISRSAVAYFLFSIVTIKESSLGTYFKKGTGKGDKIIMILIALICAVIFYGYMNVAGLVCEAFVILGVSFSVYKCVKEFGGISGDVSGFALVVGEVMGLLGLCLI